MKRLLIFLLTGAIASVAYASPKPGDFITSGPAHEKRIALSFDDGPGPETQKFLDLLDQEQVKATFFMLGEQAQSRPAVARDVAEKGHEIGNHTMTHINYLAHYKEILKKTGESDEAKAKAAAQAESDLIADMKKARGVIEKATGVKMKICRMPNGIDRPWVKAAGKEAGFVMVNWTYGADWTKASEESLLKSYVKAIKPGAIFLMHDGESHREKTLAIAKAVIDAAKSQGYQIVTVGELIGLSK